MSNFIYPDGSSTYVVGDTITVAWNAENMSKEVRLALLSNGQSVTLENDIQQSSYEWHITDPCPACQLRVTGNDEDIVSASFQVIEDHIGMLPLYVAIYFIGLLSVVVSILLYRQVKKIKYKSYRRPSKPEMSRRMSAAYDRPKVEDERQVRSMLYLNNR